MALIVYNPKWKNKKAQVVSAEKAKELLATLQDIPNDLTEEQYDYLSCIENIYTNNKVAKKAELNIMEVEDKLLNPGIAQGMYQAIPTGDRD